MEQQTNKARAGQRRSREWVWVLGAVGVLLAIWAGSGVVALLARPTPAPVGDPDALGGLAACGVANLAWSEPGRLLRGGEPAAAGLECLAQNGVDVLIDQRMPAEDEVNEAALAREAGMEYANLGVPDDTAPSPDMLRAWLEVVGANLQAGRVVLVHDAGGRGRMGFWDAVYAMRQGRPAAVAIEGAYLGKDYPFDGAKIGCQDGGNGQVQALAEISAALTGEPYWPAEDEYGTVWADCPRPAYMEGWSYEGVLPAGLGR
jgi:hypothetical protein